MQLASSNFFMQILNSPSREEIDAAHARGTWFGIGVSSVRNAFRVSTFKTWCWVALLISSIPIHLLFNSTIFETDYRGSDFHVTIATEEFLRGGAFYPPGASLSPAGLYMKKFSNETYSAKGLGNLGYGDQQLMTEYDDDTSETVRNITTTAREAETWEQLSADDCFMEYIKCDGLKQHRNLVMIIDQPEGWVRSEGWHLEENETAFWDRYVPPDQPNHLFFDTQCVMVAERTPSSSVVCMNTCNKAMAGLSDNPWRYSFFDDGGDDSSKTDRSSLAWVNGSSNIQPESSFGGDYDAMYASNGMTSGLQSNFRLSVKSCMAQPLERVCHIGLSPRLLMGVTLCVVIKTITAIRVTKVLSHSGQEPLVTPGDAGE
ncbi:hypothetical protein SLS62_009964 [Diatrype stigma]|uniref:DUF6536 domain-containing protein n=1 Tax=Diatrype stigma TaxID=117547 RepID=A0AAN9YJY2_9PEZI